MATVAPDADVLIGFLDDRDAQHDAAVASLSPYLAPGYRLVIGASVYAELLVGPFRAGRATEVDNFLAAARARVLAVTAEVARRAAQLRAEHRALRLPDALALASAIEAGAQLLTLDDRLRRIAARLGEA